MKYLCLCRSRGKTGHRCRQRVQACGDAPGKVATTSPRKHSNRVYGNDWCPQRKMSASMDLRRDEEQPAGLYLIDARD
jgi:hypothetical protein